MALQYHKFIHNAADIKQFANIFKISVNNLALCLYLILRRKYYPEGSAGTTILNRIIVSGDDNRFEDKFYRHILRLESPIGSYNDNGSDIPNGVLAIYAMVDPMDTIRALPKVLSRCLDAISNSENIPSGFNVYKEEISKSPSSTSVKFRQVDIDTKDINKISEINKLLSNLNVKICIETRAGFHIIYEDSGDKDINRALHEFKMQSKGWFSITHSPLVILPGTYQADFPARIVSLSEWLATK